MEKILHLLKNLSANPSVFEELALHLFEYQFQHVEVYHHYCEAIQRTKPSSLREIPFLPIEFFKTHDVLSNEKVAEKVFLSSGTGHQGRSKHLLASCELYEESLIKGFEFCYGTPKGKAILGLLPNYIEQGNSSLVYMVDCLIHRSENSLSGFYLNNYEEFIQTVESARKEGMEVIVFGVSYALLDLVEMKANLSGCKVIETGGMKGRRKELVKSELHRILQKGLNIEAVHSEYGMTELLSQAYSTEGEIFHTPAWMKVLIRDRSDPFSYVENRKTGGINVIDLYNVYSCSFIATQDLGKLVGTGFQLVGRFDQSEIRGCNLLVD